MNKDNDNKDKKLYIEADIKVEEETKELRSVASKVIDLPKGNKKQPDLMYFSAIFVSSGENLNHAYFLGSELVAAEGTIINKALDIEHSEDEIIGHIYEKAYIDKEGNKLDIKELASRETASLDGQDMHIAIAGIIYKARFPNIAQEVADNKFKVSMECYFTHYDVKVGDLILDKREAEVLGIASTSDDIIGKVTKIMKSGKEIASGTAARVLRGICFSGCGIVKNPANPPSIIMETAGDLAIAKSDEVIVLSYDTEETAINKVTSSTVDEPKENIEFSRDGLLDDSLGICVNYKKFVLDKSGATTDSNWCSAYDCECTSFSRDTSDVDCLRNKDIRRFATAALGKILNRRASEDRRKELLDGLKAALCEAVKTRSLRRI